ncbi:MAG: TolC family protein [Bacteroidota bacterium]|nr:TolC family protein [Bacteroidota bacterium]
MRPDTVTLFQDYPATIRGQQNVESRPKVDGFVEAIYVLPAYHACGRPGGNALFSYHSATDKTRLRALQLEALRKAVEYTLELLRAGFANYTEVLQAQQSLLQAQLNGVNNQLQQRQAVTDFYYALGGGWR